MLDIVVPELPPVLLPTASTHVLDAEEPPTASEVAVEVVSHDDSNFSISPTHLKINRHCSFQELTMRLLECLDVT